MKFYLGKKNWVVQIDKEDAERVLAHRWHVHVDDTNVYARRLVRDKLTGKRHPIYLHRFILGVTDPKIFVDHENRDGLDCRKTNLKPVTIAQNNKNVTRGLAKYAKMTRRR